MEKSFVYFPDKTLVATPADVGMDFEDLMLTTEDGLRINGWYVLFAGSSRTLLWFHGNAGNIGHRVDLLSRLHRELKMNIFIVDYRGYGKSEGEVSEEGTRRDARAAYDYLIRRPDVNPRQIVVFGRSLGAAVAVELAAELEFGALILEAPFASVKAMARESFPWFPSGLLKIRYDSLSKIKSVHLSLLVLHGDRDQVVPFQQGRSVFEAANEPKWFYTIANAGHNDSYIVGGAAYYQAMFKFIEAVVD